MIDIVAYPLPKLPPPRWFPQLDLTQEFYDAKCVWLLPRLHMVANHIVLADDEPGFAEQTEEVTQYLHEIVRDELASWITCCWASLAITTNLGSLSPGWHWAVTADNTPPEMSGQFSDTLRNNMHAEAAHYLTAVSRGAIARPLKNWGAGPTALLLAILLDALAHSQNRDLPQPVTAVPGEWPPRRGE